MRDQARNGAGCQSKPHLALGPAQLSKVKGHKRPEACLDIRYKKIQPIERSPALHCSHLPVV